MATSFRLVRSTSGKVHGFMVDYNAGKLAKKAFCGRFVLGGESCEFSGSTKEITCVRCAVESNDLEK